MEANMKYIQPNDFLEAYRNEWIKLVEKNSDEITESYRNSKTWTSYMVSKDGFLSKIMNRLSEKYPGLEYKREYYTLDALYVGGEDLFRENKTYPSELHALIEHEQGGNVEEEMWKLIFWRSPLKIIIFYDWNEYEKDTSARKDWLNCKIKKLINMLSDANIYFQENANTNYLFIIGNRIDKDQLPQWRWASNKQIQPISFVGG